MNVLKEIKLIAETKSGDEEVSVSMGINWGTSQPIYSFNLMGCYFDRRDGNMFRDHKKGVSVKIKDMTEFEKAISDLINVIRNTPDVWDQEKFDNL